MKLLKNASFYTLDENHTVSEALLIDHGRVLAAGSYEDLKAAAPSGTAEEDLGGSFVFPGLTDAHVHLHHYAISLQKIDCETESLEECLARVRARWGRELSVSIAPPVAALTAATADEVRAWAVRVCADNDGGELTVLCHLEPQYDVDVVRALRDFLRDRIA